MNGSLAEPLTYSRAQRAVLASITLGGMLVPLNSTMLAIALPDVMRAFAVDVRAAGWLVTAYLFTMAALQLVAGKLGDQLGRQRLVLGGLVYFGLSSLLAALSPGLPVLLFARIQQAVAGSILLTNGIPLVYQMAPGNHRGRDLGLVSAALVLAAAAGPPLGGWLVSLGGWRAVFWVNIPIVLAALLSGWSTIVDMQPQPGRNRFDWREIALLFRIRPFVLANGAILFSNFAMYVVLLAVPMLMATQSGWSSLQTGLVLSAMSVTIAVFTPVGGRLSDRTGRRAPGLAGTALMASGVLPLAVLPGNPHIPLLLACLGLMGIGLGLSSVALQTAVLEAVQPQQAGLVTGISSTSRYLGSIGGSLLLAAILGSGPVEIDLFQTVFLVVTLAAGTAMVISWGLGNNKK